MIDVSSEVRIQKDWLLFWLTSRIHTDGSQVPCCELPDGEAYVVKKWGSPPANSQGGPESSGQQLIILGVDPPSVEPSDDMAALADTLNISLWKVLKDMKPDKLVTLMTDINCGIINICYFKLLCGFNREVRSCCNKT